VHFVLVLAMFFLCEVVFDVSTRDLVSFGIADAQAAYGAEVLPPKLANSGSRPSRLIEVDRFRLDAWVVPDPA
jgi:hypothetical protein